MADGAGGEGRASHGMDPKDFRHTGLRLEWGHAHAPDGFEVFSLAVSPDGTAVCAGGACPADPGCARVWVWLLGEDDEDEEGVRLEELLDEMKVEDEVEECAEDSVLEGVVVRGSGKS